jgi:hypothetical protein
LDAFVVVPLTLGESGRISKSGRGEIDIRPINGRSWAAISRYARCKQRE